MLVTTACDRYLELLLPLLQLQLDLNEIEQERLALVDDQGRRDELEKLD